MDAGFAEPGGPFERERDGHPLAGRDGGNRPLPHGQNGGGRTTRGGAGQTQFDPDVDPVRPAEVLDDGRHRRRGVDQWDRVGQRQVDDGEVVQITPGNVHDGHVGPGEEPLPEVRGRGVRAGQEAGEGGPLGVGEDEDLPAGVAAGRLGHDVGREGQPGGEVAGGVGRLEGPDLGRHLVRVGGRPGDDGLGMSPDEDDGKPVTGVGRPNGPLGEGDGLIKPGAGVGPGGHAQGAVHDQDVVRPGGGGHGLGHPGPDGLPDGLGPRGGRTHAGEQQHDDDDPGGEEEPAIDPPAVPLLGGDEEPDGGPRHDVRPLAAEQVDEDRDGGGGPGGGHRNGGQGEGGDRGVRHGGPGRGRAAGGRASN